MRKERGRLAQAPVRARALPAGDSPREEPAGLQQSVRQQRVDRVDSVWSVCGQCVVSEPSTCRACCRKEKGGGGGGGRCGGNGGTQHNKGPLRPAGFFHGQFDEGALWAPLAMKTQGTCCQPEINTGNRRAKLPCTHTDTQRHTHSDTDIRTHARMHTHTHRHTHTHTHTQTHR